MSGTVDICCPNLTHPKGFCFSRRTLSTSAVRHVDDLTVKQVEPCDARRSILSSDEAQHEKALAGYITIDTPVSLFIHISCKRYYITMFTIVW